MLNSKIEQKMLFRGHPKCELTQVEGEYTM